MTRLPAVVIGKEVDPRVPKNPERAADADHKVARIVWYGIRQISGTRDPKGKNEIAGTSGEPTGIRKCRRKHACWWSIYSHDPCGSST
jgi:hypothetical protein